MIYLITGVPGAGKTLYAVAERMHDVADLGNADESKRRRICAGGIPGLELPHVPLDMPEYSVNGLQFPDFVERKPGEPAHDVLHSPLTWWRWCKPGDVIVLDECQYVFPLMAPGTKVPAHIAKLDVHRHYGVDFILISQTANKFHANVRGLIGSHEFVRRMFGGAQTVIYSWDHAHVGESLKGATSRPWRHPKRAFKLYTSSQQHNKQRVRLGAMPVLLLLALLALPAAAWYAIDRMADNYTPPPALAPSAAASSPVAEDQTIQAGQQARTVTPTAEPAAGQGGAAALAPLEPHQRPEWAGCISLGQRCECVNNRGFVVTVELGFCVAQTRRGGYAIPYPMQTAQATPDAAPQALVATADGIGPPSGPLVPE